MLIFFTHRLCVPFTRPDLNIMHIFQFKDTMASSHNHRGMDQSASALVHICNIIIIMLFVNDCNRPWKFGCIGEIVVLNRRLRNRQMERTLKHSPNCDSFSRSIRVKPDPFLLRTPHFSCFISGTFRTFSTISSDLREQQVSKNSGQGCLSGSGSSSPPILTSKIPSPDVIIEPFKHK